MNMVGSWSWEPVSEHGGRLRLPMGEKKVRLLGRLPDPRGAAAPSPFHVAERRDLKCLTVYFNSFLST